MTSQADAIADVIALYGEERPLCVADIGSQSCWLRAVSHHSRNLYLSGPMGQASSVALGLALNRPTDRILAICGDGALAMNLSSLVTIANERPTNLTLLVIANDAYEYTARLPSPSRALDWVDLGVALFGQGAARRLQDADGAILSARRGPALIVAKTAPSPSLPPALGLSPVDIRDAFRRAVSD